MNRKGKGRVRHARGTSEDALTGIDGQSDALTSVVDILSKSNISDQQEAATNEEGVVGLIGAAEHAVGRNVKITGTSSQQRNPKKRTREDLTTDAESEDTDDDQTDGEAIKTSEAVSSLIDVEKPQVKGRRGRDRLLVKLAIICRHRDTDKLYWRCSATNCDYNRGDKIRKPQVLNHAKVCQYLDESLKLEAERALIDLATTKREKYIKQQQEVPALTAKQEAKEKSLQAQRLVVLLVCCDGLVPRMLDSPRWKDFVRFMNPKMEIPSSTTFREKLIAAKASEVQEEQKSLLQRSTNLTITFDGGTTRKRHSMYTIHVTTPDRKVYFVAGEDGTGHKHDTNWLTGILEKWVQCIGPHRFAAIGSDSASLTKSARRELTQKYPTILNFADPCHHLNLTIKDITALPDFKDTIQDVKAIVAFFSKSHKAAIELRELNLANNITRGLEKVGRTRFATHYWSVLSTHRSHDQIEKLVRDGKVTFGQKSTEKSERLRGRYMSQESSILFKSELLRYIKITEPIVRTIQCLESANLNVADVYVFWLAIAATLRDLFDKPQLDITISEELKSQITTIVNRRYKEFIDAAPSDIYFAGFFLDPRYVHSDILRKPTTMSYTIAFSRPRSNGGTESSDDSLKAPIPKAYARVRDFLKTMIIAEGKATNQSKPYAMMRTEEFVSRFRQQLLLYAWGKAPFDQPWDENGTLKWWMSLEDHPEASCLAMLAIKIHSICPNTMADERTMSTFTWFNSALRNRQNLDTLVSMAQVRQFHKMKDKEPNPESGCKPLVRWRDINKDIFRKRCIMVADIGEDTAAALQDDDPVQKESTPKESTSALNEDYADIGEPGEEFDDTDEDTDESELVDLMEEDTDRGELAKVSFLIGADDNLGDYLDISSPFLRDLLSESPLDGAAVLVENPTAVMDSSEQKPDLMSLLNGW